MDPFVQVRSWHIIRSWTRVPGRARTLCGLSVVTQGEGKVNATAPGLPAGKSCETCLRIDKRRADGSQG